MAGAYSLVGMSYSTVYFVSPLVLNEFSLRSTLEEKERLMLVSVWCWCWCSHWSRVAIGVGVTAQVAQAYTLNVVKTAEQRNAEGTSPGE